MGHKNKNDRGSNPGFDLNSLSQMDMTSVLQLLGTIDMNQLMNFLSQIKLDPNDPNLQLREGDPRIQVLQSLKTLLPPENAHVIDEVLKTFIVK
jgi:hypothetical protein